MSNSYCPDYYDVLMVPPEADAATVRAAFHMLIRRWHPDCAERGGSQERASGIIEAYRTLSHPERRRQYDRRRRQIPMAPGLDRRRGERRQSSDGASRRIAVARPVDRDRAVAWGISAGVAAMVAIATFLPELLEPGDLSRDVLRALM